MTEFNPTNKERLTYGECLEPAMHITEQEDADQYFSAYIKYLMQHGKTEEQAISIAHSNLGYWAGYHDHEIRLRVERLFNCVHPIFGPAKDHVPTSEEAFRLGVELGQQMRTKQTTS